MNINIQQALDRIDARLVDAVRSKLGTRDVALVEHRPTGVGVQTVPVFRVPAEVLQRARALGLEAVSSCVCGGAIDVDDAAEKPITVNGDPWTRTATVVACNQCEFIMEVSR